MPKNYSFDFDDSPLLSPPETDDAAPQASAGTGGGSLPDSATEAGRSPAGAPGWLVAALAFMTVFFAVLAMKAYWPSDDRVGPGPGPDPVDGAYVAIFWDDEQLQSYSASQREFVQSAVVAAYLDDKATEWYRIDVDENTDGLPAIFREFADMHRSRADAPWLVAQSGRKLKSEPIVSVEAAMKTLGEVFD